MENKEKENENIVYKVDKTVVNDIMNGYESKTTFFSDFSIADSFGLDAIQDTFNRAFNEWKDNYIYLTELVLVLNWKLWLHYEDGHEDYAKLYDKLWRIADEYAVDHLEGDELSYFYNTTD